MRVSVTVLAASALASATSCGPQPELISEEDLVPPAELEATLTLVEGWVMGAVTSDKVSGELPLSHAMTTYSSGDASIDVDVTDSGMIARAYANIISITGTEPGDHRDVQVTINGNPGVENWDGNEKKGLLVLLVANRFVVSLTGRDVRDITVVRDFASKLDVTKLTALREYESR